MKCFLTSVFLITMCFAKGQVVNIPDTNFRNALIISGVDINADSDIQNSEAEAVIDLALISAGIGIADFTGIKAFTNMRTCKITGVNAAASLDVSNMTSLEKLEATNLGIYSLDITGCTGLKELKAFRNQFSAIDISTCLNLEYASLAVNSNLQSFHIGNNTKLSYLNIAAFPNLHTSLDLTHCDSLTNLDMSNTDGIDTLNISGLTKILFVGGCSIKNLIATNCIGLTSINYPLTIPFSITNSANFTGCINLERLEVTNLDVSSLDLSTCINLKKLRLSNCGENFESLSVKNGSFTDVDYRMMISRPLNVCADDFEVDTLRQLFPPDPNPLVPTVNVSSYCTFYPGGNFNNINGTIRLDANNNSCDITDRGMDQVFVKMTDTSGNSISKYTTANGNYVHYPYEGIFTLTPYFPYPYFNVNPVNASVIFDTANNLTATRDFCITANGIHNDLAITFLPMRRGARAGFNNGYALVYKNRGTTTLSGNVKLNYDGNKMNFISATTAVNTQSFGELEWNYNNLQPFESRHIDIIFYLLPTPVNNIGDSITYLASITPSANDETAFDNSFILPQLVQGSYDPNDKQCLEGSKLDISKIGSYLHYQIHFQNEGTDTAFNIVVADTLSNNLDWNSFEFIGSSHTVDVKLTNNKLEFFFQNINLPHKAINEPASNGWVAFKIKPKPSVVIGDSINNKAAIYFDFNLPVITNTAITIVSNSSGPVPLTLGYFSANKKDNGNQLNWKATCNYGNAVFVVERSSDGIHFNAIGNINATALRCQLPFSFIDNNPAVGKNYYRLKIIDADGISFYSKVLVVGNNKAGLEIAAVVSNTVYLNSNKQQVVTMKVIADDGTEITTRKQTIGAGNNNIGLQIRNVSKGIYSLIIYTNEGETMTYRFIK